MTSCNRRPPPEHGPAGGAPTQRQQEVLAFIHAFKAEHEVAPSIRDMCERFGWASTNGAQDFLLRLQRRHLLTWLPGVARSWRLTESGKAVAEGYLRQHPELLEVAP
ncbi:hypothetical protein [Pyxidicoccus caerfyrddinensis]|uniref:LexA family protein n=1 Tax=Pyxidicoccus caerfyrddinensis TaxID=2709663 RepID=UPI0013DD43BB|nr:hypothetical protein [Pyxidicoccus caerfyrddinensis]